jgi:uncharacterized protein (DUF2126 family)
MGEEATGSGTARYVDSSVERVEIKVSGLNPQRHVITCNGRPIDFTPQSKPVNLLLAFASKHGIHLQVFTLPLTFTLHLYLT